MSETELQYLEGLNAKMDEILRRLDQQQQLAPRAEVLTLEEAAAMLRLQPASLRRGLAGTRVLPRHSDRPVTFRRSEVEKFIRERSRQRVEAKDARQRLSLVRRKPRKKAA